MAEQEPLQQSNDPPPLASAIPPTTPLPYVPPEPPRSKWPTIVGILAIIWGSLGILGAIWAAVALMIPGLTRATASQPSPIPHSIEIISGPINAALAVLLLIGGVKLISRRILGVRLLKTWAVIDVITTVGGLVFAATGISQMIQDMRQTTGPAPMPPGVLETMVLGGMCVGLVFGIAPPIFALVWFARRTIKDEVATWA